MTETAEQNWLQMFTCITNTIDTTQEETLYTKHTKGEWLTNQHTEHQQTTKLPDT